MNNEMVNGAYGNTLRISGQENILANTNAIELISPTPHVVSRILVFDDGVIVGTINKTVEGIDFIANEYVEYVFKEGDIHMAGEWTACLISLNAIPQNKILNSLKWTVSAC